MSDMIFLALVKYVTAVEIQDAWIIFIYGIRSL